jgi:hypothetical protein
MAKVKKLLKKEEHLLKKEFLELAQATKDPNEAKKKIEDIKKIIGKQIKLEKKEANLGIEEGELVEKRKQLIRDQLKALQSGDLKTVKEKIQEELKVVGDLKAIAAGKNTDKDKRFMLYSSAGLIILLFLGAYLFGVIDLGGSSSNVKTATGTVIEKRSYSNAPTASLDSPFRLIMGDGYMISVQTSAGTISGKVSKPIYDKVENGIQVRVTYIENYVGPNKVLEGYDIRGVNLIK